MNNTENLCMGCMRPIGEEKQCSNCGCKVDYVQEEGFLPIRAVISDRYLVGKCYEHNGDGASYMGWDLSTKIPVVIREYFPDAISSRSKDSNDIIINEGADDSYLNYMTEFIRLWKKMIDLNGRSAMVDVYDVVEANNTVYAVHEYVDGISLREYLLRTPTGYISWDKARPLFMPVLSTLGTLHAEDIIHRGISPVTLIFDADGKLRVTGFSIAEARTARGELNDELFPGYAAIEQYGFEDQQGPWTDIYAFSAVLYRALIGSDPMDAKSRITNDRLMIPGRFAEQLPAYVINGLINALQILPEDRTRNIEQFRAELSAAPSATVSLEDDASFSGSFERVEPEEEYVEEDEEQYDGALQDDNEYQETFYDEYVPQNNPPAQKTSVALQIFIGALSVIVAVAILLFVLAKTNVINFNLDGPEEESTTAGYSYVTVPNFVNRSYDTIKNTNSFTDNFVFSVSYDYSDTVEEGIIISQDLIAGKDVPIGQTVKIVVSKGVEQISLINVEGMSYDSAVQLLSDAGFTVEQDTVTQENDGAHAAYTVYKMSPSNANRKYDKGTKVILTVWAQPETTTLPDPDIPDVTVEAYE